jgi:hypothetical protein
MGKEINPFPPDDSKAQRREANEVKVELERIEAEFKDPRWFTDSYLGKLFRSKVSGGWLLMLIGSGTTTLAFYPDPDHKWDGNSLP